MHPHFDAPESAVHAKGSTIPANRKAPVWWVPTLYFAEGLPMVTVSVVAALMYKNLGVSNTDIALYTGSLYLPWSLKPLWAPVTEMFKTKRHWVLAMEFAMAVSLALVAFAIHLPNFMAVTLAFFWVTGFLSSTQDIAADGVYISVTTPKEQSAWVGVQGICWNIGKIVAVGALVTLTGYLFDGHIGSNKGNAALELESWQFAWMVVMCIIASLMAVLGVYHIKMLPQDARVAAQPKGFGEAAATFWDTIVTFFQKPGIWLGLAFILLYRSGEGFIEKIGPLFLMDKVEVGGLALSNQALGNINGIFGTIGFMLGALGGGLFASKMTLKRSIVILALVMNIPHICYNILAHTSSPSLTFITAMITIEKIGYGFGSVAHMLYMMQQIAPGKYRTAHYAFATSLMNVGVMVPSMVSGAIQESMGYGKFFMFVLVASIPSVIAAFLAPFPNKEDAADSDSDQKPPAEAAA